MLLWEGTLPPPEAAETYERLSPGIITELLSQTGQELTRNHEFRLLQLRIENAAKQRGTYSALAIALTVTLCCFALAWTGKDTRGFWGMLYPLGVLVVGFIAGKIYLNKGDSDKDE